MDLESRGTVAKTKALVSFAVTAKLICVFVVAYAKCWFSHHTAHLIFRHQESCFNKKLTSVISQKDKDRKVNSADSDQTVPGAVWSVSSLFVPQPVCLKLMKIK